MLFNREFKHFEKILILIILIKLSETKNCSPGYYGIEPNCKRCPDGHYCPIGSSPIICPAGTVNFYKWGLEHINDGRTSCLTCSKGYYNDKEGGVYNREKDDCRRCSDGHYCPKPESTPIKCPAGTVNFYKWGLEHINDGRTSCLTCSKGYYNDKEGGVYNREKYDCRRCPDGHYCPKPESTPIKCPVGTVNFYKPGLAHINDGRTSCLKCSEGYYNDKEGGVYNNTYIDCFKCPLGNQMCQRMSNLAVNGDCDFYIGIEDIKKCGNQSYPLNFGHRYCQRFGDKNENFNDEGKKWIDSVRKCLMKKLLTNNQYIQSDCMQLQDFAFETHYECYRNPGYGSKDICDIWFSKNGVGLLSTYEIKEYFKPEFWSQLTEVAGGCVKKYGSGMLNYLSDMINLTNLIG